MTDRGGWARGGLVVVALGLASNLALTFVPDIVPDSAAQVIVYCMTAVIVVVAPLWVYRELVESSRRREVERRRMRGIEAVGGDYSREGDTYEVWGAAKRRVLCMGFGLTGISADEDRIVEAVGRGVRVDFVMVDPHWLREQPQVTDLVGAYYDEQVFLARVEKAHVTLRSLAKRLDGTKPEGSVHVHTYRSWTQHSATIADPWSPDPSGYLEFHVYRRHAAWIRLRVSGFDGPPGDQPYVSHIVREVDRLLGYQLETA
ncbi:hypothetical protein ACFS27_00570 [Promicromonospora vindobonensis]|uniref:Uncharacterized protein n=1 Tax=Promicromonospora vindobonensis TaxID=195748 RepID=A0ABW5VL73_9MICO